VSHPNTTDPGNTVFEWDDGPTENVSLSLSTYLAGSPNPTPVPLRVDWSKPATPIVQGLIVHLKNDEYVPEGRAPQLDHDVKGELFLTRTLVEHIMAALKPHLVAAPSQWK
jgi:hypothetical protein